MSIEMKHVLEKEMCNPTPTNDRSCIAANIVRARIKSCCYNPLKLISSCRSRRRGRSRLSQPLVRLSQPRTASTRGNSQISRRILWRIGTPADSGVRLLIISVRIEPSVTRIEGGSRPGRGKGRSRHGNRSTGLSILSKKRHGVGGDIGE